MKSILVAINSKYVHTALGLRYVNEFCRKNAIEVTLIEETIQTPLLAVLAEITRAKPEVVGFSVHIWNKTYVYSLIELVRKVLPVAKIVVAGPAGTYRAKGVIGACGHSSEEYSNQFRFDF